MKNIKYFIFIMILFIFLISCVSASDNSLNNHSTSNLINYNHFINLTNKNYNLVNFINRSFSLLNSSNSIKDNLINTSFNNTNINKSFINHSSNIYHNKSNLVNLSTDKDKHNINLFNGTLHNQSQYNRSSKLLGLNNNSFVNNVSKEVNLTNKINKFVVDSKLNNLINKSSIHYNKSNLVNSSINKDKHNVGLFNGTLHNQNQYNKTCKLLGLNHSINNDSIFNDKELNISKSNSNMCDDSREDNFLINHVPESDNKDYNILLLILPLLLVLLGAIILYKRKK